MRINAKTILTT